MNNSNTVPRTRNYTMVFYPEHIPDNMDIKSFLESVYKKSGVAIVCSPLHDKDILKNGKPDKPHYHLIFKFGSVKSLKQAYDFEFEFFNQNSKRHFIQKVQCNSIVDYLTHKGFDNKYPYDPSSILWLGVNGKNEILNSFGIDKKSNDLSIILDLIRKCKLSSFGEVVDAVSLYDANLLGVCFKYAYAIDRYCLSSKSSNFGKAKYLVYSGELEKAVNNFD